MKILLTGATSGIGYGTLVELVKAQYYVVAIGRDFSKINSFIEENQNQIEVVNFDLSKIEEIEQLFMSTTNNEKFDAMIHCAGIEETVPITMYTPNRIKELFEINVFSGIELLRNFTKKKFSNDGASVVYLSSVMGILGQPGKLGYCSSKSAILGMVKSGALEVAKRKIRVNAILPGIVKTPMTELLFSQINDEQALKITNMHPLGLGEVEDVVPMILFLISNKSRWITGQSIVIDGGYSVV